MGGSGIVAQIILLRELLISFLGNELTLGTILANWLILEAIGSFFLGKTVERVKKKLETYIFFQLVFSITLPFSIYLCRIFKNLIVTTSGEGLGVLPIIYSSALIITPVALFHGSLFTYGCKLYAQYSKKETPSVGRVYVYETIGSIIGGLLFTFILIQYLHSFEIAFMVSLANTLISALLLWPERLSFASLRKSLWVLSLLYSLLFLILLLTPIKDKVHHLSIRQQWKGLKVIHYENSIYGNITITRRGEQTTFFTDGIPSITTPTPDVAAIEDFVHFPMLFHEKPESILVLSGGAGGMIHEILKYPVKHVDYVELDPLLLKLVKQFPTPLTENELSDPRVKIHYVDGRFFTKRTKELFDLIFIGLEAPQELQTNRLFSFEFFEMAKAKMRPKGILTLSLPGSLTYISPELKKLNGCILDTLIQTFPYVRVIPGDTNIILASDSESVEKLGAQEIAQRLTERKISTHLFTKNYVEYRLHKRWSAWFSKWMEGRTLYLNSDFRPIGVYLNLSYWNALFSPYIIGIFKWFENLNLSFLVLFIGALTLSLLIFFIQRPIVSKFSIPYAIFTSGITDMMLDLAIILTFQTLYGYLYFQIGLLVTVFMIGIASSSLYMTYYLDQIKKPYYLFLYTEFMFILFALLLPFVLILPSFSLDKPLVYGLLYGIFQVMSFICGVLVGLQFPLATKIYLLTYSKEIQVGETAGLLYGADLFGGFWGALFGGIFFFPVLGLKESCFTMAILKGSSLALFLVYVRNLKSLALKENR
ncbi:MAG: fused MFS/spermidine synthase [Thermodesulfobacteriota bacterium]